MRVDETRRDIEAADVDHRPRLRGIDTSAHTRDLSIGDRHVHDGVHLVAWIDDVSALEQDLIPDLSAGIGNRQRDDQQNWTASQDGSQHALIVAEPAYNPRVV